MLEGLFGLGWMFRDKGDDVRYEGTVPDSLSEPNSRQEVYIIPAEDIERLLTTTSTMLLSKKHPIPDEMYKPDSIREYIEKEGGLIAYFPDEIDWKTPEGEKSRLFLERFFLGNNPHEEIWIRYASVEKMMEEEDPDDSQINGDSRNNSSE